MILITISTYRNNLSHSVTIFSEATPTNNSVSMKELGYEKIVTSSIRTTLKWLLIEISIWHTSSGESQLISFYLKKMLD